MRDERGAPLDGHSFIFWSRRGQDRDGTVCGKCGKEIISCAPGVLRPFEAVLNAARDEYRNHHICSICVWKHAPDAS